MIATNYSGLRENLKTYMDTVSDDYETVVVTRKENRNIVMMSEKEYNEIMKAKNNAEYLSMLEKSMNEAKNGGFVMKTMEELEDFE